MREDMLGGFRKLQKKASQGYWGKRILGEIGYLIGMFYQKEAAAEELLGQAVEMLVRDYRENGLIQVQTAKEAEQILLPLQEKAKSITMICVAHAHIDMNWMWGMQETVALTLDTVRTMLTLMEEYPEFTYAQSQASVYHILEQYAPDMLAKVKQRVHEGRWEVTASTWVENDKNMSGGESMARHLLCTKKYLSNLLDIPEETLNLDFEPDTFGHSYNLPEVLRNGGVTRYYHCRGDNGPYIYRWKGMSGAEVLMYREPKWYGTGAIDPYLCDYIPGFCNDYGLDKYLAVYGVGDHGGGPSRRDIEDFMDRAQWPLYPTVKFGTFREFFDYLEERKEQFPILDQELNYVFTGCYTSQSRIKMANHIGEIRLTEAEMLDSMAKAEISDFQRVTDLEDAWRKQIFNQFHDILPGSGTVETREYAMGEFQKEIAAASANATHAMVALCDHVTEKKIENAKTDCAMGAGVGFGSEHIRSFSFSTPECGNGLVRYMALFNVTQESNTDPVEIIIWDWQDDPNYIQITDLKGNEYPYEILEKGQWYCGHCYVRLLVWMPVPPNGYTVCRIQVKETSSFWAVAIGNERVDDITDEPICLENDKVKAVFDSTTMKCISFVRKSDGKELISSKNPACGFSLITEEVSNGMTAWRVGRSAKTVDLNETCYVLPKNIKTTGMYKEIRYGMSVGDTKIDVTISLKDGCEYLDYTADVSWTMLGNEQKGIPQLRFIVPCAFEAEKYRYTIPYGMIDRTPLAQDVPAIGLGCALPKDGGSGLYLVCDTKYGFRGDKEGLSLNLIRASYDPDPYPEIGRHVIHMAVGACDTDKNTLAMIAEKYFHPVIIRSCTGEPKEEVCKSIFRVEGGILTAAKIAYDENGFILRVYNPSTESTVLKVWMPGRKITVFHCDFLENDLEAVAVSEDDVAEYQLGGGEICSLRLIV